MNETGWNSRELAQWFKLFPHKREKINKWFTSVRTNFSVRLWKAHQFQWEVILWVRRLREGESPPCAKGSCKYWTSGPKISLKLTELVTKKMWMKWVGLSAWGKKENPLEALSVIQHSWDKGGGVVCDSHLSKPLDDAATAFSVPQEGGGLEGGHVRSHVTWALIENLSRGWRCWGAGHSSQMWRWGGDGSLCFC